MSYEIASGPAPADAGETEVTQVPAVIDSMVGTIVRAELDTQIATAKAHPRSITRAIDNILSLATLDEQTAAENVFALPRGGKPIRGPSVRLAEIIYQQWGNCRVDARVISIDREHKIITAEGTFHDLETNAATRAVIQRRISDKRGRLFSDDMIVTTGNAACAIAKRNAILSGVPKPVWRRAYEASEQVVAGDIKTLAIRREAAIKAFAHYGVKPEQIFAVMEVKGIEDISLEHIPTLQGMFSAIKSGESTVEEIFGRPATAPADNWQPPSNEAGAVQATGDVVDPETGEITSVADANKPAALWREEGEEWRHWCERLIVIVRKHAKTVEEVDGWTKANDESLQQLLKDAPKIHTLFMAAVGRHRVALVSDKPAGNDA